VRKLAGQTCIERDCEEGSTRKITTNNVSQKNGRKRGEHEAPFIYFFLKYLFIPYQINPNTKLIQELQLRNNERF
jgi:hypothetical protein